MTPETDDPRLFAAIASQLTLAPSTHPQADNVRIRLFDRVRESAKAHQQFLTVRREDVPWLGDPDGPSTRTLRADSSTRVEIIRLRANQTLPWPADVVAQEILVLSGGLARHQDHALGADPVEPVVMPAHAHCLRWAQQTGLTLVAIDAVTLYVRQLLVQPQQLPALEALWWQLPECRSGWADPRRKRWLGSAEGVEVMPLRGDGNVVSMLVRFAPGASVSDHHHALHEDCLVLEGEMFLGDILLRSGDYQLAPAGGSHVGETSDVGVVFFFHGALDDALKAGFAN